MVVGDGLLARALSTQWARREDVCLFASGVSDSACTDPAAFARERALLERTLQAHPDTSAFVYFGTCSANTPAHLWSAYTRHKVSMEARVLAHPGARVARLPQVAGRGGHPATLLNHLSSRIASGTEFELWVHARRRVVDALHLAPLIAAWLDIPQARGRIIDLAPPLAHRIEEIIDTLECVLGRRARYRRVDRGQDEPADTRLASELGQSIGLRFDEDYLRRTVMRHYGAVDPTS